MRVILSVCLTEGLLDVAKIRRFIIKTFLVPPSQDVADASAPAEISSFATVAFHLLSIPFFDFVHERLTIACFL